MTNRKPLIYLASPYSSDYPEVREWRFEQVCREAARLIKSGYLVYSPIAHSHPMVKYELNSSWPQWEELDRRMIEVCDKLWVLKLLGWDRSVGVSREREYARELGKPERLVGVGEAEAPYKFS